MSIPVWLFALLFVGMVLPVLYMVVALIVWRVREAKDDRRRAAELAAMYQFPQTLRVRTTIAERERKLLEDIWSRS